MEGQRSLLPARAQGETQVAADVSPPWGNGRMGLLVLHRDPKKDRAEGGVHTGWMRLVCGRDSVGGEASAQEAGSVPEEEQDEGTCGTQRCCLGGGGSAQEGGSVRGASIQEEGAINVREEYR